MSKLEEIKASQGYPNRFRVRQWIKVLEKRFKKESKELVEVIKLEDVLEILERNIKE